MKPFGVYVGKRHPAWAEFKIGGVHIALHADREARPYRGGPIEIQFKVGDINEVVSRIGKFGGRVTRPPKKYHLIPQRMDAFLASFTDPDGHKLGLTQVVKTYTE